MLSGLLLLVRSPRLLDGQQQNAHDRSLIYNLTALLETQHTNKRFPFAPLLSHAPSSLPSPSERVRQKASAENGISQRSRAIDVRIVDRSQILPVHPSAQLFASGLSRKLVSFRVISLGHVRSRHARAHTQTHPSGVLRVQPGKVVDQELEAVVQRFLSVHHGVADLGHVGLLHTRGGGQPG